MAAKITVAKETGMGQVRVASVTCGMYWETNAARKAGKVPASKDTLLVMLVVTAW